MIYNNLLIIFSLFTTVPAGICLIKVTDKNDRLLVLNAVLNVFEGNNKDTRTTSLFLYHLKTLEKQIKNLYILAQSNNDKHIKGKKRPSDSTHSKKFNVGKIR